MEIRFEPDLDFQIEAIESVCRLFAGQEDGSTLFTVRPQSAQEQIAELSEGLGVGNELFISPDNLLENLKRVQIENALTPDEELLSREFTVEMETGTGKTYVYLRTIMELRKRYGFTKFIIVVPSLAIKEGVLKTLEMTESHLKALYGGVTYDYFVYDSDNLNQVRAFALSPDLQIMVMTVGAINKVKANRIYQPSEITSGERPIDLLSATNPIVIVDEPQSVEGGLKGEGRKALENLEPLCTLRYSATPKHADHRIYKLDAVDAYEKGLVKQIELASATVTDAYNRPYARCLAIRKAKSTLSARLELDAAGADGAVRTGEFAVFAGDDLEEITGREVYRGWQVGEIRARREGEAASVQLETPEEGIVRLEKGGFVGGADHDELHDQMIRKTVEEHFEKELHLRDRGIKVLSLFFIDEVAKYRDYGEDGQVRLGPYADMFEKHFIQLASLPKYSSLFDGQDPKEIVVHAHNGYFSKDKQGREVETSEGNHDGREAARAAYELIMKDKEKLLGADEPLRFIFSHSALREGWDNPNVFQICTLRDIRTEIERRQTIGRGLRLCVNQDGERDRDRSINVLTVIATEGYQEFAEGLQKEIEGETSFRFGVVTREQLAAIPTVDPDGTPTPLGTERAEVLLEFLRDQELIDPGGKVTDRLREALNEDALTLPEDFDPEQQLIKRLLKKLAGRLQIKDASQRREVKVKRAVLDSEEFRELWERINKKTTYRVTFDEDELIRQCAEKLEKGPVVPRTQLQWHKAGIDISAGGVEAEEFETSTVGVSEGTLDWPDLLGVLQEKTQLTRESLARILIDSGRLDDFKTNPNAFIEMAAGVINRTKRLALVNGVAYQQLDGDVYAQERFLLEELTAHLDKDRPDPDKSVTAPVVYDSDIERKFADQLDKNTGVKVYAKLPSWFEIPTPLGAYNPDWALVYDDNGTERLYFVVETKGSQFSDDLRNTEAGKIECGKKHFEAIATDDDPAEYIGGATRLEDVLAHAGKSDES